MLMGHPRWKAKGRRGVDFGEPRHREALASRGPSWEIGGVITDTMWVRRGENAPPTVAMENAGSCACGGGCAESEGSCGCGAQGERASTACCGVPDRSSGSRMGSAAVLGTGTPKSLGASTAPPRTWGLGAADGSDSQTARHVSRLGRSTLDESGDFASDHHRRFGSDGNVRILRRTSMLGAYEAETAWESPLNRAPPPPVGAGCESCEGWKDEGFYCAYDVDESGGDADIESDDQDMLDLAYDMINDYMYAVEGWFRKHSTASDTCPTTRLSGGDFWYPKSMIYETVSTPSWNATNLYGSRYMLINWAYLKAFTNTYKANSGNSDVQDCVVLGLARTIVHETFHSCWITSEISPTLAAYYFGRVVAKDKGITSTSYCCASAALAGGYKESGYTSLEDVEDDANYERVGKDTSGTPVLVDC